MENALIRGNLFYVSGWYCFTHPGIAPPIGVMADEFESRA
jgi:hypothetical protein